MEAKMMLRPDFQLVWEHLLVYHVEFSLHESAAVNCISEL